MEYAIIRPSNLRDSLHPRLLGTRIRARKPEAIRFVSQENCRILFRVWGLIKGLVENCRAVFETDTGLAVDDREGILPRIVDERGRIEESILLECSTVSDNLEQSVHSVSSM